MQARPMQARSMQAMIRRIVLCSEVLALSLLMWAEGGAPPAPAAASAKREAVSVRLPGAAFAAPLAGTANGFCCWRIIVAPRNCGFCPLWPRDRISIGDAGSSP